MPASSSGEIHHPKYKALLHTVRNILRTRRDALVEVVRRDLSQTNLPLVPEGGLHLWLKLPGKVDGIYLSEELRGEDVVVSAGRH